LQHLLPWLIVIAFIGLIEWLLGWQTLLTSWQQLTWQEGLIAVLLMLMSYQLRTWRLYDYFQLGQHKASTFPLKTDTNPQDHRSQTRLTLFQRLRQFGFAFRLMLLHNVFNNLLPARSGELSFPLLMKRYFALDYSHTVAALLWFRLLDLHSILLILLLPVLAWFLPIGLAAVIWLAFLLIPWLMFRLQCYFYRHLQRKSQSLAEHAPRWVKLGLKIVNGLPQQSGAFWRSWLLTLLNWSVKLLILAWLLVQLAEISIPFDMALSAVIGGELTSVLPIHAPAGIGTYEAGLVTVLSATHSFSWLPLQSTLSVQAAMILAINVHLFVLSTSILGGLMAWFMPKPTALTVHSSK